eukprot:10938062-Heterocapsa_arctica.AAC.1
MHHGQRNDDDFKVGGDPTALSWHWDRIVFAILSYVSANLFECQTKIGYRKLLVDYADEERGEEILLDAVLTTRHGTHS